MAFELCAEVGRRQRILGLEGLQRGGIKRIVRLGVRREGIKVYTSNLLASSVSERLVSLVKSFLFVGDDCLHIFHRKSRSKKKLTPPKKNLNGSVKIT